MSKTLKQLLDQVNGEIGFDIPGSYVGNTVSDVIQLVAIANRSAILLRELRLQYLTRQWTVDLSTGTATDDVQIQSYPLPSDFFALVPDTVYQLGRVDPAQLPTAAPTWAYLRSRTGPQGFRVRCRFIHDRLYVFSPEVTQSLDFEYVSTSSVQRSSQGKPQPAATVYSDTFANDNDIWLLDDPLIELSIKWRYKKEKGLDWQADQQTSMEYQNALRGRDQGAQTISPLCNWPYPGEPYTNLWVSDG